MRALQIALAVIVCAISVSAEIIPSNRRTAWNPGVTVGIPTDRNTIYTNLYSSNTVAQINAAIANCPSNQVVYLNEGNYTINSPIIFNNDKGVTLRGAGTNTYLAFTTSDYGAVQFYGANVKDNQSWPDTGKWANWTNGYTQGATTIYLDNTNNLSVGYVICLDQLSDNIDVTGYGGEGLCNYCSRSSGARPQAQYVRVTAISNNVVTISPGLYMPNWSASLTPQAWWWGECTEMCGIEDMTVDYVDDSSTYGIVPIHTYNCWVKNITSLNGPTAHINLIESCQFEVRHNIFRGSKTIGSQSYGLLVQSLTAGLAEDNIFERVVGAGVIGAQCEGLVYAYNYSTNMYYQVAAWMILGLAPHAAHNCFNLFEGNHANGIGLDFIHGSGSHNTVFRNRLTGWETGKSDNTYCISVQATNHYHNIVGNILGTSGYHDTYQRAFGTNHSTEKLIYSLGYFDTGYDYPDQYDASVVITLLRHGNYDVVNDAIVWDGEIEDVTLPNSYYLESKPSFFGSLAWPPFNPTNTSAAYIDPTNIPAGYRFVYGEDPPADETAPTVTTDPQSQTNVVGSDITFTIIATGTAPLSYQWRLNGSAISVSTATSYTTNNVTITSNGSEYDVVVTNSYGSVTSAVATLTITNATTFYASPTGNDAEDGLTPATAWTLYYALTNAGASNTIVTLDGTYTGNFVAGAAGQRLLASNKWDSILVANGDAPLTIWPNSISNCIIDGLQITGGDADSGIYIDAYGTTIQNCWVHHNGTNAAGYHYGIEGHELRDTTVQQCLVEFNGYDSGHDHGIYIAGTNATVRGNVCRHNAAAGIQVYFFNDDFPGAITTNAWIYNNLSYSNGSYALMIGSIGAPTYYVMNNTFVQGAGAGCIYHNDSSGGGQDSILAATNNIFIGSTVISSARANMVGDHNYTNGTLSGAGFVDTDKGLYWLTSGSGARNQANTDIVPPVDFFGNAQASVADAGFNQYSTAYAADTRALDPSPAGGADYWEALSEPSAVVRSRADRARVGTLRQQ